MSYTVQVLMLILFGVWIVFSIYAGVLMARVPYAKAKQMFHWTMMAMWWYGFAFWVFIAVVIVLSFVFVFGKFIIIGVLQ